MVYRMYLVLKDLFVKNLVLQEGGYPFYIPLIGALVAAWLLPILRIWLLVFTALYALFFIFFFRNPDRFLLENELDESVIVSPCDGKIVAIEDMTTNSQQYAKKISIFLSPLDVHVNWIPMDGTIKEIIYHRGSFYPAFLPKASELNERNDVVIINNRGQQIKLRQITGTLARTIVCWVETGELVKQGHRYGMMKFGSRIDMFVPSSAAIDVTLGQRVSGGLTVLGRWIS